jgi:arylsulfate sulfotransferase
MKPFISIFALGLVVVSSNRADAASVVIGNQTAGPTPFIRQLQLTATPAASIKSINFQITPQVGSVTRPLAATYPSAYLTKRGYYNSQTGAILLPVFGLYANYTNTVMLTYTFTDNSSQQATVMMATPAFGDPCGYSSSTIIQARTNSTALSYDYIMLKGSCSDFSPTIIDTDGRIRWVATGGTGLTATGFFQNSVYTTHGTTVNRVDLDGTSATVRDYATAGVGGFHHNIDPGKRGMIFDVDTSSQTEAINIEIDALGNILKTWNLADIITAAMTAGGDNASLFVKPSPNDWFHNNAVTYKRSDDSLIVSSRENFAIALDYETGVIRWIFGDPTKHWHQFPSLVAFALTAGSNTLYPIGQHALSITSDSNLLLFDNGKSSLNHTPPGADRTYSAPRKYQINTQSRVATELWNYPNNQILYAPFCSSIYEDSPLNYLVDYAYITNITPPALFMEVLGLDAGGNKIFDYRYPTTNCGEAWNAIPLHLEATLFSTIIPVGAVSRKTHGSAGGFDIPLPLTGNAGVECRSGGPSGDYQVVVTFASPVTITTAAVAPGGGGTGSVSGTPVVSGSQVTVNLTNVSNVQTLAVNLMGVNDGSTTENISVPMGVLLGDTNGDHSVNSSDVSQVKSRSGQPVTISNFQQDVTANGSINGSDVSLVKSKSGSGIP